MKTELVKIIGHCMRPERAELMADEILDLLKSNLDLDEVAIAIGHHFWKCENDDKAKYCAHDVMIDIKKRLNL